MRQGMKKKWILVAILCALAFMLAGCTEADKVSANISKEADNFNVTRRVTIFNTRTDKLLLEVVGALSVQRSGGDINIIIEVAPNTYKKHFVSLNSWTTYVVEDISGAYADKYHYEINFLPEMIVPVTFTQSR